MTRRQITALSLILTASLALTACANQPGAKPTVWFWWPSHWKHQDFVPYQENAKGPHNNQWDSQKWTPEDWVAQRGSQMDVIAGFYTADIIRNQYVDRNGLPILVIGPGFYRLGGNDKRRVTETIDHIYHITSSAPHGSYQLYDWESKKPVGVYTSNGLQIQ